MRALILATSLALTVTVVTAGPFDGNYYDRENGPNEDYCATTPEGGVAEIKANQVFFYETSCHLSNPVNVRGMDAKLYDAECSGEGPTSEQRIMLMRPREGDGIIVLTETYFYDWVNCNSE